MRILDFRLRRERYFDNAQYKSVERFWIKELKFNPKSKIQVPNTSLREAAPTASLPDAVRVRSVQVSNAPLPTLPNCQVFCLN